MPLDLSAVLIGIRLLQRPVVLETPRGKFVEGIWEDSPASVLILASVQAASQKDLTQFSTGDQVDGYVRIYTETELRTVDEDLGARAQVIITDKGVRYRIVKAGLREEANFTRAIGRLINDRGRNVSGSPDPVGAGGR
jgi:hypothetical protein